jgi:hypothetical protein
MLIVDSATVSADAPAWRPATRLAFRLCATYFALYLLPAQMPPVRVPVSSVATHVFGVRHALVLTGSGSGDKTFDWVHAFTVLVASLVITAVWSILDRRREHYSRALPWVRLAARFALGATMVSYGMLKAIPVQMPAPGLTQLLEPFGHFSPMGVLWYSIGASRPYEIFAGCAELAGGVLLFIPHTATLGALICLADTVQIFALNMSYDIPVKLFSFHLILLSLFILAPESRRLVNVVLLNRAAGPSTLLPIGRTPRARRIAVAAQAALGLVLVASSLVAARQAWTQYGGGAPRPPLYGIWNVEEMQIDGNTLPPLVTDFERFRRVVFDRPNTISFQGMDDTFVHYGARVDTAGKSLLLTLGAAADTRGRFTFEQPAADRLILNGEVERREMRMQLRLVDRDDFLLVSRGFHWVQEYPFNR